MERRGRLCVGGGGGSVWWQHLYHIRMGDGLLDDRWLSDNIIRQVDDGGFYFVLKRPLVR